MLLSGVSMDKSSQSGSLYNESRSWPHHFHDRHSLTGLGLPSQLLLIPQKKQSEINQSWPTVLHSMFKWNELICMHISVRIIDRNMWFLLTLRFTLLGGVERPLLQEHTIEFYRGYKVFYFTCNESKIYVVYIFLISYKKTFSPYSIFFFRCTCMYVCIYIYIYIYIYNLGL